MGGVRALPALYASYAHAYLIVTVSQVAHSIILTATHMTETHNTFSTTLEVIMLTDRRTNQQTKTTTYAPQRR